MSCSVRGKHIRTSRRLRSSKHFPSLPPPMDISCAAHLTTDASSPIPKSSTDSDPKQSRCHRCSDSSTKIPNHTNPNPNLDESNGWGYCTEEQLEEILMKNLELFYSEAMLKLVALGYDEETASKAILKNGYCNGGMDVMTNILHNALAYLNSSSSNGGGTSVYSSGTGVIGVGCGGPIVSSGQNELVFSDLRQLQEYSLKCMVSLLQQVRPQLSKGDAMWCLLMCDLHVGRASTIEFPFLASARLTTESFNPKSNVETICNSASAVAVPSPPLCRFHGGWGFGNGGVLEFPSNEVSPDIECPKRFNLSPSMKALLKKNVAAFAAGFRANTKHSGPSPSFMAGFELGKECRRIKNQEQVNSVLSKFRDLNLDEKSESVSDNQKDEMIVTLTQQIKDLERQVKERKEWAHQKAMQAARRLCTDLTELKLLRMEMEETQRLKQGKQTLEESTMKRLPEMEDALRKASSQVDRANAAVRRLETENAEIRAEMEASKLSASESVTSCLEVAKREKKCLKRLLAWEKQKTKLQEEIAEEKHKISDLQQELVQLQQDSKEAEVKWRQLLKEKELALTQVEEEQRAKEATEASNKRKIEALRMKIEVDSQRHKDDLKRLEQDLSRLKASESHTPSVALEEPRGGGETIARLLNQLDMEESSEINVDRRCLLCKKDEVSVVFLPCAHQVICCKCCDNYGKKGRATCPCCRVLIEQKIRVFGASS